MITNRKQSYFLTLSILIAILLTLSVSAASDPFSVIPSNATFLIRIDVKQLVAMDLYKQWEVEKEGDPKAKVMYEQFTKATGVKIEKDVIDAVVAVVGEPSKSGSGHAVAVVSGTFDGEKIVAYAKQTATTEGKTFSETTYNGVKIYSAPKEGSKEPGMFAVLSANTMLFGTDKGIKAAIDTSKGTVKPVTTNQELMALRSRVKAKPVLWGVGSLPKAVAAPQAAGPAAALQNLKTIIMTADMSPNLDLYVAGDCDSPEAAGQVKDALNQAMGLAMMFGAQMGLAEVAQKIQISSAENTVAISLSLTPEEISSIKAKLEQFKAQQGKNGGNGGFPMGGGMGM